ncbi:MAG TPA: hypothetical protein VNN79_23210, partial [Actinomycetota bacterium]|nr:hypothetical protein [Actinomycetota bacterium]
MPTPNVGTDESVFSGVAATSSTNAWAVGGYSNASVGRTLIEHWDGRAWKVQPSPPMESTTLSELNSVAATSSTNAWAV